ncbi:MAG: carbohydrate ABC transporter permease [Xylanivirga thermophila]|jgi:multiple sugar transport system permease protein|uniref:carbohydrate ABC transporter permease n=1 Tax=Xylanivirga thermophila TaxID=2496273 RepID=UPI0039F60B7E
MEEINVSKRSKSMKRSKRTSSIIIFIILALGSLTMIIPFFWMITTSFDWDAVMNVPFPPRFWPAKPSIKPYQMTFMNVPMGRYLLNSFVVAVGVIIVSCLSALLAGYSLSKIKFKGSGVVLVLALSTMMIPFEVTMIPQYLLFDKLNLKNTYWAFYLPAVNYAFGTFLCKQYMDSLPESLREAALIDGAGEFTIFTKIYVPLCGAIIATMVILQFLGVWNDLLWPLLILSDTQKYTVQIGIAMFTYNQGINQMPAIRMASATISLLPVLILYLFLQRYIVESIALTGLKQ